MEIKNVSRLDLLTLTTDYGNGVTFFYGEIEYKTTPCFDGDEVLCLEVKTGRKELFHDEYIPHAYKICEVE